MGRTGDFFQPSAQHFHQYAHQWHSPWRTIWASSASQVDLRQRHQVQKASFTVQRSVCAPCWPLLHWVHVKLLPVQVCHSPAAAPGAPHARGSSCCPEAHASVPGARSAPKAPVNSDMGLGAQAGWGSAKEAEERVNATCHNFGCSYVCLMGSRSTAQRRVQCQHCSSTSKTLGACNASSAPRA